MKKSTTTLAVLLLIRDAYAFVTNRRNMVTHTKSKALFAASPLDPYDVLEIPFGTTDAKVIKRAYKRKAMKYHPDVNKESDASEKFIEVCNAYETLSGRGNKKSVSSSPGSSGRNNDNGKSSSNTWEPPHRRASSYSGSSRSDSYGGSSADWRDYMNIPDDSENYDAGGDSFGAIFSDLFTGVAAAAAGYKGKGGVLEDLISFLEGNVDGFASDAGYDKDPDLLDLLSRGNISDVRTEVEDAELLLKQLDAKYDDIKKDVARVTNELELNTKNASSKRASEVFRLDEELNEQLESLQARQKVVLGYMKKARRRLDLLQERLSELLKERRGSSSSSATQSTGTERTTSRSDTTDYTSTYSTYSANYQTKSSSSNQTHSGEESTRSSGSSYSSRESFGSSGRGRSRSRQKRSEDATARSNYVSQQPNESPTPNSSSNNSKSSRKSSLASVSSSSYVPPHRRTSTNQYQNDKKRLR